MERGSDSTAGKHAGDRSNAILDNSRLMSAEKNSKPARSRVVRDVTIAEIEPQQVGIRGVLVLVEGLEPPLG